MARPEPEVPLPSPNPERVPSPGGFPARMNWGIDVPEQPMPQVPGMMQFNEGLMANPGQMAPPQDPQMVQATMGGMNMMPSNPIGGMQRTPGWFGGGAQMPGGAEGGRLVPTSSMPLAQSIFANESAGQLPMSPFPFFDRRPRMPFGMPMMGPGV